MIKYKDRQYLSNIVRSVNPSACSISAYLLPNIPNFLKALKNFKEKKNYEEAFEEALKLYSVCNRYNILPFWALNFSGDTRKPEIEYKGPKNFSASKDADPYRTCCSPMHFVKNKLWFSIGFSGFSGERDVRMIKGTIEELIKTEYFVSSLDLHIFHEKGELYLFASDGNIHLTGEIPDSKSKLIVF